MRVDVVVLGAGPAGSAAAGLLAHWGHDVLLIDRAGGRRPLAESLPPSCTGLLEATRLRSAVDAAGFVRATGNTVWWGGEPVRVEHFPGGATGYQVQSDQFDAIARQVAANAGAAVWRPANPFSIETGPDSHSLRVSVDGGDREVEASWVLDCTGRTGVIARIKRPAVTAALRTMAVVGEWERPEGWGLPDETHTLVESAPWGWGWSVPVTATRRFMTVMLDPAATPLAAGPDLALRYHDLLGDLPALGGLVKGAAIDGAPWACDATPYAGEVILGPRQLAVGDAASFIDPLSSFGVKKALASAWLAAVTVHTSLLDPARSASALDLFAEREREYVVAATRELGAMSKDADRPRQGGFWGTRASLHSDELEADSVERLRDDVDVRTAFEALRSRESARLVPSPALVRTPRPIVRGNVVVEEEHLAFPGLPPARYVRNVDLLVVLDVGGATGDVGEMYTQYTRRLGPVSLPDFLGAIAVIVGKGGARFA